MFRPNSYCFHINPFTVAHIITKPKSSKQKMRVIFWIFLVYLFRCGQEALVGLPTISRNRYTKIQKHETATFSTTVSPNTRRNLDPEKRLHTE